MLYGRQEIRVLSRGHLASLQQIGYVIAFGVLGVLELSVRGVFTRREQMTLSKAQDCLGVIWSSLTGN